MTLSMCSVYHHLYYLSLLFPSLQYSSSWGFAIHSLTHNTPPFLSTTVSPSIYRSKQNTQSPSYNSHSTTITTLQFTNTAILSPGIDLIDSKNEDLYDMLQELRDEPYFKLYSVDMLGSCEYMPQQLFECSSETCEIYPVDDEEVPPDIRAVDTQEHYFELDGWARFDMPTEDYYDLEQFPEGFTAYDGSEIWKFIHDRIAFHNEPETKQDEYDADNWKADFNKAVSGLHSMISAQVCRGLEEVLESGEKVSKASPYVDPKVEFNRRLNPTTAETSQALENLYFTYMLILSAVRVARDRLLLDCESGKIDPESAKKLQPILSYSLLDEPQIQVASKKLHDHAMKDSNTMWQARMRTRELFRIMNCVQCNKCKLHGKISALGLSTALQVLLGTTGEGGDVKTIHRVELASLLTVLHKFSSAVQYVKRMILKSQ